MQPNWTPLENLLGTTRCVGFMYMGRVNGINQYKHGITRTYLYLDDAGRCYLKPEKGGYTPGNWGVELGKMEIGIGGTVTRPPLPHHRTCGSASGGSVD